VTDTAVKYRLPVAGAVLTEDQLKQLSTAERREYLEAAKQVAKLKAQNPLGFWEPYESAVRPGYSPQASYLASRGWIKAFFGGNGSGKSAIGTVDDLIQLCDPEVVPQHLRQFKRWQPPFYLRVVAPKMSVIESVVLEKFRELTPRDQLRGGSFDKAFSKELRKLHFRNGSWVLFNTSDQDRDAHAGVELHRVRFDEEPTRPIYDENVARLRSFAPEAQLCFTMTPLFGMSWVYDEVWERRDEPHIDCFVASMFDNPFVDRESMERALAHLSEAERAAVVEGQFVSFHGRVLNRFDPEQHVVDAPTIEHAQALDTIISIDPGIRRSAVTWNGFDRRDNVQLVYDELYPESATVTEICAAIRERNAYWGLSQPTYIIDPSARNRALATGEATESAFHREGIFPLPAQNDRQAGINQMRARCEADALLVARGCVNTLKEFDRWLVADDEVTREQQPKGKGTGEFRTIGPDHLADTIRYAGMERTWYERPDMQYVEPWKLSSGRMPSAAQWRQMQQKPMTGVMGKYS